MGQPAAKQGDQINAIDIHLIKPPGKSSPVMVPHPFAGIIDGGLSKDVNIMRMPAATINSNATNTPTAIPQGGTFIKPPTNRAIIITGSPTVFINGKMAARNGDIAMTCNDPVDLPVGTIVATGTVFIG